MTVHILTLFPEIFNSVFSKSIIKRAIDKKILNLNLVNIRNFGKGVHKQVDDKPYGGGDGMLMMAGPIVDALRTIKPRPYTILLSASGKKYTQKDAKRLAKKQDLALICGHYEGVDARVEKFADEVIAVGDYILTGGEIPAMVLVDSIGRFLPGSINPNSPLDESFEKGQLEYPQYTRPEDFEGFKVPPVLLLGNHAQIKAFRQQESKKRTKKFRPDLLKG